MTLVDSRVKNLLDRPLQRRIESVFLLHGEVFEADALLALPVAFEEGAVAPRHVVAEHGAAEPETFVFDIDMKFLPGPAWLLLSKSCKTCIPFPRPLYMYYSKVIGFKMTKLIDGT